MGQVRNAECERIDSELIALFPGEYEIECRQDTYTQDYIVWITAKGSIQPYRLTRDEYLEDDWKSNIRRMLEEIPEQPC